MTTRVFVLKVSILHVSIKMGLASSTDEEFTATVGEDGVVTLGGHKDAIFFVYVISDDRIVSGSRDQTLKIWKHVQNK